MGDHNLDYSVFPVSSCRLILVTNVRIWRTSKKWFLSGKVDKLKYPFITINFTDFTL